MRLPDDPLGYFFSNSRPDPQYRTSDAELRLMNGFKVDTESGAAINPEYMAIQAQHAERIAAGGSPLQRLDLSPVDFFAMVQAAGNLLPPEGQEATSSGSDPYVLETIHATAIGFGDTATPDVASIIGVTGIIPGEVFVQNSEQAITGYQRQELERLMGLMRVEDQLKGEFGNDIKLAYDKRAGNYIMLRPGDAGYDQVDTGAESLEKTKDFFRKGSADINDFTDIFKKYGRDPDLYAAWDL